MQGISLPIFQKISRCRSNWRRFILRIPSSPCCSAALAVAGGRAPLCLAKLIYRPSLRWIGDRIWQGARAQRSSCLAPMSSFFRFDRAGARERYRAWEAGIGDPRSAAKSKALSLSLPGELCMWVTKAGYYRWVLACLPAAVSSPKSDFVDSSDTNVLPLLVSFHF